MEFLTKQFLNKKRFELVDRKGFTVILNGYKELKTGWLQKIVGTEVMFIPKQDSKIVKGDFDTKTIELVSNLYYIDSDGEYRCKTAVFDQEQDRYRYIYCSFNVLNDQIKDIVITDDTNTKQPINTPILRGLITFVLKGKYNFNKDTRDEKIKYTEVLHI